MNPNVELVKALRERTPRRHQDKSLFVAAADCIEVLDKQLADIMDPNIQSMRLENGKFDMALGGPMVQNVALMMTEWFRESGAKNYIEMTLHARTEPFERYQFYVQKQGDGAKTPHELRKDVEAENERLSQRLAVLEMVIFEELTDCDDAANQMIVDGVRERLSPAVPRPTQNSEAK